jgi:hypothetical protein
VAGVSWVLGYLVSSIPASWSPTCFSINGTVIVCPDRSLPSIPFVPPQVDVISMWTMSQRMASLSIQFTVSSHFQNRYSLTILFLPIFIRVTQYIHTMTEQVEII